MATGSAIAVPDELEVHERVRLARLTAKLRPDALATALGISKRSYERREAGDSRFSRAELVLLAQLTDQDPSLFGVTSPAAEVRTLPSPLPGVKVDDSEAT